jgi:hypothetical protein
LAFRFQPKEIIISGVSCIRHPVAAVRALKKKVLGGYQVILEAGEKFERRAA